MNNKNPLIIAEIGINHSGSLEIAKRLIDMATICKVDLVKFQKRYLPSCIPERKRREIRETPWGRINYYHYKQKLEFDRKEYDEIDNYCKTLGINWFASAWDFRSLDFLRKYNLNYNKVASPMLTNIPLINAIAKEKKKTFISTGMSTMQNVEDAVSVFQNYDCPFVLMHCVGTYPAKNDTLNLRMIETLKNKFECEIGFSDHSSGVLASSLAISLGATVIEKHISLDRSSFGTDQSNSVEKHGLELIVRNCHLVSKMLGDGNKKFLEEERIKLKDLKYW